VNLQPIIDAITELELFLIRSNDKYPQLLEKYRLLFQSAQKENDRKLYEEAFNKFRPVLYGGMGSLNDLVISKFNDHIVNDEILANKRLKQLLAQLKAEFELYHLNK
jgi:hypothetical protein